MTEAARQQRNRAKLEELHPVAAVRVAAVIRQLEQDGWRPRIQEAYRSPDDQLTAFRRGRSKARVGFHNVTSLDGKPEALAADVLDDSAPLNPSPVYLIRLAHVARQHHLVTGILWGLPPKLRKATDQAVADGDPGGCTKLGWDPTHVECAGLTMAAVKKGARPS